MAATDLLTIQEARSALRFGVTDVELEPELERLISSTSQLFDDYFGAMVARTVTAELHDTPRAGRPVRLRVRPAYSITTVTVDGTAVASSGYTVGAGGDGNLLYRLTASQYSSWQAVQAQGISVTYDAGRYADTASVPAKVKDAALLQLRHMVRPTQFGVNEISEFDTAAVVQVTAGLSRGVKNMFPELRSVGIA